MEKRRFKNADKVRYVVGTKNEDGVILPIFRYYHLENAKTVRYQGCTSILFKLDNCSKCLIDWLSDNMTINNIVYSNAYSINSFISDYNASTGKVFTLHTVRVAFKKLCDLGLLIRINLATYQVNPEHYFRGTPGLSEKIREEERHKSIRKNLEAKKAIVDLQRVVNE